MSEQHSFHQHITHRDYSIWNVPTEVALTTDLFRNEVYSAPVPVTPATFDPYQFAGVGGAGQAPAGGDVYGYSGPERQPVSTDIANPQFDRQQPGGDNANPQLDQATRILTDANSSAIAKLHVVQALANAGVNQIDLPDADGQPRTYSIRTGQIGNKTMVHLFAGDDQGNERIVLRGVINDSGSFDKEHDDQGNQVDFEGTWWQEHMSGRSLVGTRSTQDQSADQNQSNDPYQYNGGGRLLYHIRGDSSAGANTTDDGTNDTNI